MRAIVLGAGFLGKAFEKAGFEVWGKDKMMLPALPDVMDRLMPYDVVINCIGKSNTRWCEDRDNFQAAMLSNAAIPRILSDYCMGTDKQFVHISTGCLYDHLTRGNTEKSFKTAHCNYTVTKWAGEMGCHEWDLVLRPRLLFSDAVHPKNLLSKIATYDRFLTEYNSYTSLRIIVEATKVLLVAEQTGVFNVACDGCLTVYDIATIMGLRGGKINSKEMHRAQKLFLVSNTMDIAKLYKFYQPPTLKDEVMRCWKALV